MHQDKYVFSQLVAFLDRSKFNRIVAKYDGGKYVKHFTCWNQLLALMFGQLSNRESLRDLIIALEAHQGKAYHLGLGKNVTRSNLSKANKNRDYHIFESFAYYMVEQAQKSVKPISLISAEMFMLSIQQPLTCVWLYFGGQNSVRKKEASKYIHCMMWKLTYLHFSI